jgi:hypothetical protein
VLVVTFINMAVVVSDSASDQIWAAGRGDSLSVLDGMAALLASSSIATGGAAGAFVLVVVAIAVVLMAGMMFTRFALIHVVVAFAPIVFAADVGSTFRGASKKFVSVVASLVLAKPVMTLTLVLGSSMMDSWNTGAAGGTTGDLGRLFAGAFLFLVAAFSPVAVFKLLPVVGDAAGASGGLGRAAITAAQTAMAVKTLGSVAATGAGSAATRSVPGGGASAGGLSSATSGAATAGSSSGGPGPASGGTLGGTTAASGGKAAGGAATQPVPTSDGGGAGQLHGGASPSANSSSGGGAPSRPARSGVQHASDGLDDWADSTAELPVTAPGDVATARVELTGQSSSGSPGPTRAPTPGSNLSPGPAPRPPLGPRFGPPRPRELRSSEPASGSSQGSLPISSTGETNQPSTSAPDGARRDKDIT